MYDGPASITDALAAHVAGTRFERLPADEVDAAETSLIETMAVAVAAAGAPGVEACLRLARRHGVSGQSSLWVSGEAAAPARAAFVNSVCAAALDFDSLHHLAVAHSDIVVVPAAVAVAQDQGCDGRELLTAIALGNDVLCRLALATRGEYRGWFFSSVYGVIAAAAVAARLLGGDARVIRDAMGLAFMNSAGTFQGLEERSMAKRGLAAFAAQTGVDCAYLAIEGFDGPRYVVEGRYGLYSVYQKGRAEAITEDLGVRFEGSRISRKPFPTCQCNQAAIEAALALRSEPGFQAEDIERVEVVLTPYNHRLVGAPFDPANNPQVAAQFSAQYSVACALLRGALGIAEIQEQCIHDSKIAELVRKIDVVIDSRQQGTYTPATIHVHTVHGKRYTRESSVLRGSVAHPLSPGELQQKVAQCIDVVQPGHGQGAAVEVLHALRQLRDGASVKPTLAQIGESMIRGS